MAPTADPARETERETNRTKPNKGDTMTQANTDNTLTLNGRSVPVDEATNLLEVIRAAKIDLPTFCYHSDLSVYGACRLCIVEVEGRGIVASCSTPPAPGMIVRTHTEELREMRRTTLELLLANHPQTCTTCVKSTQCKLQDLAQRFGIEEVAFKRTVKDHPRDDTNPSLVRDPNKCVLCGDCVRFCSEIQAVGAIDFVNRGAKVTVAPAYNKGLGDVECVFCGQCAAVCPTGAITPRNDVNSAWSAIDDPETTVVVQIAPAVRVALGEEFGLDPGTTVTWKMVAALKTLGFDQVYDTSFAADLTVVEEATEFLGRVKDGARLPQFTSCCPGWVKFVEQFYPDLLANLSSCRSPQQMFGSVARRTLPEQLGVEPKNLVVVSIMPCTAKKFEASRAEFATAGQADVDLVLTTRELAAMIRGAGLRFNELNNESFDLPLGFKTGAGVIFGNSGGVSEAVVRFAHEKVTGERMSSVDVHEVRGEEGVREAVIQMGETTVRMAIVHGLANARRIAEQVRKGICEYDFIEVMACPGGCIGGAGQPVSFDDDIRHRRTEALYAVDKSLQVHHSQDNPYVQACYRDTLGDVGGHESHRFLHTEYSARKRIGGQELSLAEPATQDRLEVDVCLGTSCFLRGSQELLQALANRVKQEELEDCIEVKASFCHEKCDRGPVVVVGGEALVRTNFETAWARIQQVAPQSVK